MLSRSAVVVVVALALPSHSVASDRPGLQVLLETLGAASGHGIAEPPLAAPGERVPSLRLVWIDPSGIAECAEAIARLEVVHLLRGLGLDASWRLGQPQDVARRDELRVILLDRAGARHGRLSVLGATPARFEADPLLWVHVPSVGAAVGVDPQAGGALDLPSAHRLGIGLARVVAHEVVHALAPSLPHGHGLMAARLDQRTLTAPSIAVDPKLSLDLRSAWRRGRASVSTGALLTAQGSREELGR
jgi:hypothetical protein